MVRGAARDWPTTGRPRSGASGHNGRHGYLLALFGAGTTATGKGFVRGGLDNSQGLDIEQFFVGVPLACQYPPPGTRGQQLESCFLCQSETAEVAIVVVTPTFANDLPTFVNGPTMGPWNHSRHR